MFSPELIDKLKPWLPAGSVILFLASSFLMIWRLEKMSARGFEGTLLGTLIMPYCSGLGNIIFVFIVAHNHAPPTEVIVNCLVNNVTNFTLLIGLPAVLWKLTIISKKKVRKKVQQENRLNRLSLLFTLASAIFFIGVCWALGRDGTFDFWDGIVMIALFLFWQCIHIFEVLKNKVKTDKHVSPLIIIDLIILGLGSYALFISIDWLVKWLSAIDTGFISAKNLGWLTGWLMVLPNAILALYYGIKNRADVVYSSQVGDAHICIPLCIGLISILNPVELPAFFNTGCAVIAATAIVHMLFVSLFGRLHRIGGSLFCATYAYFLYVGLV